MNETAYLQSKVYGISPLPLESQRYSSTLSLIRLFLRISRDIPSSRSLGSGLILAGVLDLATLMGEVEGLPLSS